MDRDYQRRQLTEQMQKARERYLRVEADYDGFLKQAHEAEHGSQAVIDALQNATAIGPNLTAALKDYCRCVESLVRFDKRALIEDAPRKQGRPRR